MAVSYTHLDVYKRQGRCRSKRVHGHLVTRRALQCYPRFYAQSGLLVHIWEPGRGALHEILRKWGTVAMIGPKRAEKMLTSKPPDELDALIDKLPAEDVRALLRVAVRLLWGKDVA